MPIYFSGLFLIATVWLAVPSAYAMDSSVPNPPLETTPQPQAQTSRSTIQSGTRREPIPTRNELRGVSNGYDPDLQSDEPKTSITITEPAGLYTPSQIQ